MNLSPKFLIKLLEEKGFVFKRGKGSHLIYYNPINNKTVVVPFHNGKDMKKGTFLSILKQADIKQ
jgi:predicted RNA binding protein YcfA (HicA-like mRNA interferase family)